MTPLDDLVWLRRIAPTGGARAIRQGAGLSMADIAQELGVDLSTVWRWETGQRAPRGNRALRYAALLRRLAR